MALVSRFPSLVELPVYARGKKADKNNIFPKCFETKNKKVNYKVNEPIKPQIDLKQLEFLMDKKSNCSEDCDYHDFFMKNYHTIFKAGPLETEIRPQKKKIEAPKPLKAIGYHNNDSSDEDEENLKVNINRSHDIHYHLERIRGSQSNDNDIDPEIKKAELINRLRKLLRKFPFERKEIDNREIFSILYDFEEFRDLFPDGTTEKLMEKFCAYATLETVPAAGTPVFGHFGFHLILKGHVSTMSIPHLNVHGTKLRPVTPEPAYPKNLGPGACFGTITELKGREITTKMFRVMTQEEKCEFLKLSFDSYTKITKKLISEENLEIFNIIRNCKAYGSWPKHAIEELIKVFEWRTFSPNTILASEGYRCPFIGFTIKGVCHVLRKVDIKSYDKKRKVEVKKMKQVVIGKIKESESFGEKSVTMNEQMYCTIVTESECQVGIIPCDSISELDNLTVRLLLQTDDKTFADLTQDDLHKKFIEQEKKKEWKEFKASVVNNVVAKYGIVQGKGRHADC